MKADKRTGLKQAYYQSFFALIVVPILTVILVSVGIIRATLSESSVDRIRQAQERGKGRVSAAFPFRVCE